MSPPREGDRPRLAPETPDQLISLLWKGCMLIFLFVDVGIIASVIMPLGAAAGTAVFLAAVTSAVILVRTRRSEAQEFSDGPSQ
jgi:hypothetical protein